MKTEKYIEYTILDNRFNTLRSSICAENTMQSFINSKDYTKTKEFMLKNRKTLWFENKHTKYLIIFNFEIEKAN